MVLVSRRIVTIVKSRGCVTVSELVEVLRKELGTEIDEEFVELLLRFLEKYGRVARNGDQVCYPRRSS